MVIHVAMPSALVFCVIITAVSSGNGILGSMMGRADGLSETCMVTYLVIGCMQLFSEIQFATLCSCYSTLRLVNLLAMLASAEYDL